MKDRPQSWSVERGPLDTLFGGIAQTHRRDVLRFGSASKGDGAAQALGRAGHS